MILDPRRRRSAVRRQLPSLKPGEILGAVALADRARLSTLAAGGAFGSGVGFGWETFPLDFRSAIAAGRRGRSQVPERRQQRKEPIRLEWC
jgi:hypothetical protein